MLLLFSTILSTCAVLAAAHVPSLPPPTPLAAGGDGVNGFSPKPTSGFGSPQYGAVDPSFLFQRDTSDDLRLCGYEDGVSSYSVTCGVGYACGYNTEPKYAMCCSTNAAGSFVSDCPGATTCHNYIGVYTGSGVSTVGNAVWCPSAAPNCNTWIFSGVTVGDTAIYSGYGCTTGTNLVHVVSPTYQGASSPATTPVTTPRTTPLTTPLPGPTTTTPLPTTSPTTIPGPTSTSPVISPVAVTGGSAAPAPANVGAIAGGVVGGIAGLALIAAAIIFLLKRRKKNAQKVMAPEISRIG